MDDVEELISDYSDLISEHRVWLKPFGKKRLKRWEDFLKSNPEGAICEAATRKMLSGHGVMIEPYEDLSSGGPDFRCTKNNKYFYVEATCITKDTATKETGLSDKPPKPSRGQHYALLTRKIFYEICNKAPQCSNLKKPCILAVCTLHFQAGCLCLDRKTAGNLLTGTPKITLKIDVSRGEAVGNPYQSTELQDSVYIRPDKTSATSIEEARRTISGVLLCPFGSLPVKIVGVLHHSPNHPFDRTLLLNIEFCKLAEGYQGGRFIVEWI
ncbi:MAG: hypothetical protein NTX52_09725 [Planctomycetota bacterium]|nr:hypothetical protein [Planctomycetota bacterium]